MLPSTLLRPRASRLGLPRRHPATILSCSSSSRRREASFHSTPPTNKEEQEEANEYYTIGQHVFEGCAYPETHSLGERLARVVQRGGPGMKTQTAVAAGGELGRRRVVLRREDVYEGFGGEDVRSPPFLRVAIYNTQRWKM